MQNQVLEQMLSSVPDMAESYSESSIDVYTAGVVQMDCSRCGYSGCMHDMMGADMMRRDSGFGLQDSQPFQRGYDLPGTGTQLHLHGPDPTTITHGSLLDHTRNKLADLNGYESSIADLNANLLGFRKIDPLGDR